MFSKIYNLGKFDSHLQDNAFTNTIINVNVQCFRNT